MARSPNPLDRERVLVQAQDTGARFQGPSTNAALQLAQSLRQLEPTVESTLQGIAEREAEKSRAQAKKDALVGQGATLADAVREGKIKPTQNPWYMEAYAKESAAIRAQGAFTQLQLQSTTWAERSDSAAFGAKWAEEVGKIAEGYTGPDELSGFAPIERQFTQQTLQNNVAQNVKRITLEREQNVSSLAGQALAGAASRSGGTLTATEAIAALEPSRQMWLATGGTEAEWHGLATEAIKTAAASQRNSGLLGLTRAIGVDGGAVLDGAFGNGIDPEPTRVVPEPQPRPTTASLPANLSAPVEGAKITGKFGESRPGHKHNGIDLAVPEGTPVRAMGVGKVVAVDTAGAGPSGKLVRVDFGNGIVSAFGHLSQVNVKEGDPVAAGQVLAFSGNTGRSTGPHVHWTTRVRGQAVDPRSVAYPQGVPAAPPSAVAEVAAQVSAPAPIDPEAPPQRSQAVPSGQIARGPSLYDIAGAAADIDQAEHFISQAQEAVITSKAREKKLKLQARGQEATSYLYRQHGSAILLGDYSVPALVKELEGQGYKPEEIGEAFGVLRNQTGDSAGLMNNRMAINGADPAKAKRVMDLHLEGEEDGYSEGYKQRVGAAVLAGEISGDDGTRMVANSLTTTRQAKAEARADARADRVEANAEPGNIHNYAGLRNMATSLAGLAATIHAKSAGTPMSDPKRKQVKAFISDAMNAWLALHPGDWDGAVSAGRQAVADYGRRLKGGGQGWSVRAQPQRRQLPPNANPRKGQ